MVLLSTLRIGMRPNLIRQQALLFNKKAVIPMATSAPEQMQAFWDKNQRLKRPNSPWTIYRWHVPMATSFCHRITGISMGVSLYILSIGLFALPGDFTHYVMLIKSLNLSPLLLFPVKFIMCFPLVYHWTNGIRHLSWDFYKGYELATMYKTGYSIVTFSLAFAAFLASMSYWM